MPIVPVSGVTTTTGLWAQYAAAMAVTQLEMPGPFWPITTPWRPLTRLKPSAMWAAPCSWTTGTSSMPAGSKMSMASMNALPMMPEDGVDAVGDHGLHERFARSHAGHGSFLSCKRILR